MKLSPLKNVKSSVQCSQISRDKSHNTWCNNIIVLWEWRYKGSLGYIYFIFCIRFLITFIQTYFHFLYQIFIYFHYSSFTWEENNTGYKFNKFFAVKHDTSTAKIVTHNMFVSMLLVDLNRGLLCCPPALSCAYMCAMWGEDSPYFSRTQCTVSYTPEKQTTLDVKLLMHSAVSKTTKVPL